MTLLSVSDESLRAPAETPHSRGLRPSKTSGARVLHDEDRYVVSEFDTMKGNALLYALGSQRCSIVMSDEFRIGHVIQERRAGVAQSVIG